jgi:hypothetical protein
MTVTAAKEAAPATIHGAPDDDKDQKEEVIFNK